MPSAEKKNSMDKQAGMENVEPIKQAQIIIEHKIRNIEKRKRKIENYKDDQAKGQTLNADQLLAVSKYGEVCKTLEFAQELVKQFGTIAVESGKQQKKQARKEALDRATLEIAKVKEILHLQDLLKTMGIEAVRDDFLAGTNKAVLLTEEELQFLDDFYVEVSPERMAEEDEGYIPFGVQAQSAAEHLLALVESRPKEVAGTTYTNIKALIGKIQACGYLEARAQQPAEQPAHEVAEGAEQLYAESNEVGVSEQASGLPEEYYEEPVEQPATQREMPQEIHQDLTPEPAIQPANPPVARTVSELINTVAAPFNFLQDSELETEPAAPVSTLPVGPISTQLYVNQNYSAQPVYANAYPTAGGNANPPPPIPMPPSHRVASPFQQQGQGYVTEQQGQAYVTEQQGNNAYQHQTEYKSVESQEIVAQQPAVQQTMEQGDWSLETEDTGATGDWIQPPNNRNNYGSRAARPSNYQGNRGSGGGGGGSGGGGYNSYPRNDNTYKNGYGGGSQREGGGGGGYGGGGGNYGNSNYGGGGGNRGPRGGGQRGGQTGGGQQYGGGGRGGRGGGGSYGGGGYMGQQRQASRQ